MFRFHDEEAHGGGQGLVGLHQGRGSRGGGVDPRDDRDRVLLLDEVGVALGEFTNFTQ